MLAEALNEARLGQGRIVLVGGEAGAGKTDARARASAAGSTDEVRVLAGACDALSTPRPLGPAARRCRRVRGPRRRGRGSGDSPRGVRSAARRAAEQPTVLVLEDLHWGDEATFDVLRLLARRMDVPASSSRTYRDDGLDRDHPLRVARSATSRPRAPSAGSRSGHSRPRRRAPRVGHAIDPADLYARTGGNPFFVAQVLAVGRGAACRRRSATPSSPAPRASLPTRSTCSRPSRWRCREPSRGCSRPWSASAVALVDDCVATGLVTWHEIRLPSATSWPGPRSRTRCPRPPDRRAAGNPRGALRRRRR